MDADREDSPYFADRAAAAAKLAKALEPWKAFHPLVLAIPRGGIVLGEHLARALDGDLDVVLVRKLRHPQQPELAIGAVGEGEEPLWNPLPSGWQPDRDLIDQELAEQRQTLRQRRAHYTPHREPYPVAGRHVIVVDDGIATGATMLAALRLVRKRGPARLCVAAAVAPPDSAARLEGEADASVILAIPEYFGSVGEFFGDFRPVSDAEVAQALRRDEARRQGVRP